MNENYQDFLSLGSSLKGGDEKVEEVRFGLLSFRKEVEGLRAKVVERKSEVEGLVGERKRIREELQLGRQLLDTEQRIGELEQRLMLVGHEKVDEGEQSEGDDESDDDDDGDTNGIPISRLRKHIEQYMLINRSVGKVGREHPFLATQEERIMRLKQTILLDLSSALKSAVAGGEETKDEILKLLGLYKQMGQGDEAIMELKELKSKK